MEERLLKHYTTIEHLPAGTLHLPMQVAGSNCAKINRPVNQRHLLK